MKPPLNHWYVVTALLWGSMAAAAPAPEAAPQALFMRQLADVLEQHPRIVAERENVEALESRVDQARAGFQPTAALNWDKGRRRGQISGNSAAYGEVDARSLVITQPLFSGFGTVAETRAANARKAAGESRLTVVEQEVALDFIRAWTALSESSRLVELNAQNVTAMQGFLEATFERYDAQDATITDLAQAESRLALAEANHSAAQAGLKKAAEDFLRVANMPAPPAAEMPPLPAYLPATLDEVDSSVVEAPQVVRAAQEESASEYDIDARGAELWPSVSLRGSISDQASLPDIAGYKNIEDNSITLNVRMPLYQGGAEYARIREAKKLRNRATQQTRDTSREVANTARRAWHDYQSALEVAGTSQRAAQAAERALSGVQSEYNEGARTLLDVLDAQGELLNAQVRQTQAQADIRDFSYALLAAIGRLTPEAIGLREQPLQLSETTEK